jgi:hypothetical protein
MLLYMAWNFTYLSIIEEEVHAYFMLICCIYMVYLWNQTISMICKLSWIFHKNSSSQQI